MGNFLEVQGTQFTRSVGVEIVSREGDGKGSQREPIPLGPLRQSCPLPVLWANKQVVKGFFFVAVDV